jgi:hypothetical protein
MEHNTWLLGTTIAGCAVDALRPNAASGSWEDQASYIALLWIVPALLLPHTSWLLAVVSLAVLHAIGASAPALVPVAVLLTFGGFSAQLAASIAVTALLVPHPLYHALLVVLAAAHYTGVLSPIVFSKESHPGFTLWYREHKGPYKNVGDTISAVLEALTTAGLRSSVKNVAGMCVLPAV